MNENNNRQNTVSPNPQAVVNRSNKRRQRRKKLSVPKIIAIVIILIIYVLVLSAVSFAVFYRPTVDNSTKYYIETITDTYGNVIETIKHEIEFDETKVESYNILVLGHDRAAMLTDVFMLVNIDNTSHEITVMQIPRDTYIANHNGVNVMTNKINALFSTYYNKYYREGNASEDAYNMALTAVADDLEKVLAVDIDFSAIMDLDGFRNIVDVLGGVEIYVSRPMYYNDPAQGLYINIPAGYQTLNGEQAEGFVRYRYGYATADLGRQNAQKQFMAAMLTKAKSTLSITNISQLTKLANEIITYVDTDMNAAELLYFGKTILQCDLSSMRMMTMPGNLASGYYVMNRNAVRDTMSEYYYKYEGTIPDGMFDVNTVFNCPTDSYISTQYYKPANQIYDDSVINGENAGDIYIN